MTAIDALSVRLARLPLEVDRAVGQLEREALTAADALLLAAPALHLRIAADGIEALLYAVEHYGEHRRAA